MNFTNGHQVNQQPFITRTIRKEKLFGRRKFVRHTTGGGNGAVYRMETLFAIGKHEPDDSFKDYSTNQVTFDDLLDEMKGNENELSESDYGNAEHDGG